MLVPKIESVLEPFRKHVLLTLTGLQAPATQKAVVTGESHCAEWVIWELVSLFDHLCYLRRACKPESGSGRPVLGIPDILTSGTMCFGV